MTPIETMPLPEDPTLAAYAAALNETGYWATIFDAQWRFVFDTDELRLTTGEQFDSAVRRVGEHDLGPSEFSRAKAMAFGDGTESIRERFRQQGPFILFDTPGGRDELRRIVDPALVDLVDEIEPVEAPSAWRGTEYIRKHAGSSAENSNLFMRVRDRAGTFVGTVSLVKGRPGMSQLATATALADLDHLDRMALVEQPDRRPAAVLMADLEASSPLARRLSTSQYFAFGRRLVRAADQCIVEHGGIVGRHAGDGVVAFFLAETARSESAAARACIETARALRTAVVDVADRSGLQQSDVSLRFGLHWGATLYVGRITTVGRSEVTALGDEVNEAARIEACATGGRTIASKLLVERLNNADAQALQIDADHASYTTLADLDTATDKARRDAPAIAVCDV
jgi:class 3 adenylate cyclase